MIYMVECGFSDPAREDAWNAHYSGPKLANLLDRVPGFECSQRFKATHDVPAAYLAIHGVASVDVLLGATYRKVGGGGWGEWQPFITAWRRTFFRGLDQLPECGPGQVLLVVDDRPSSANGRGLVIDWLEPAGLETEVAWRGVAIVDEAHAERLQPALGPTVRMYRPITSKLRART